MAQATGSSRRAFLRRAFCGAVGLAGVGSVLGCARREPETAPPAPPAPAADKSRVVILRKAGARLADGSLDRRAAEQLLDQAMLQFTGERDVVRAWGRYFASDDVVGIKVNTIARAVLSTSPVLAAVVAERLQGVGIPARNVIIWDRSEGELREAGYTMNDGGPGIQCISHNNDWDRSTSSGQWRGRLPKLLTQRCSALINLPILKDHNSAGITLSMKNHYGTVDNPANCHGNGCDPFPADITAHPVIQDKQRLIIADATRACWDEGPGPSNIARVVWNYNAIMVGTDPVAMDYQAWQIIEQQRRSVGAPSLEQIGRVPKHIQSAADRGLGTNNPAQMDVIASDLA
jgi:uncharacterized protein (DUF362 family)